MTCWLGLAAALVAILLGSALSWAFVRLVLEQEWVLLPGALAAIAVGGVFAALALGFTGVRSALGRSAWGVLRNE